MKYMHMIDCVCLKIGHRNDYLLCASSFQQHLTEGRIRNLGGKIGTILALWDLFLAPGLQRVWMGACLRDYFYSVFGWVPTTRNFNSLGPISGL